MFNDLVQAGQWQIIWKRCCDGNLVAIVSFEPVTCVKESIFSLVIWEIVPFFCVWMSVPDEPIRDFPSGSFE